jgi:hypothetical protein
MTRRALALRHRATTFFRHNRIDWRFELPQVGNIRGVLGAGRPKGVISRRGLRRWNGLIATT